MPLVPANVASVNGKAADHFQKHPCSPQKKDSSIMSLNRDLHLLVEKEKQARLQLALAEKAKHELEQALLDKTAESHTIVNHYLQELDTKNELIFALKNQNELLKSRLELIFEDQLKEVKREHLVSQQMLRKEIEELWSIREDNEIKNERIQSLKNQMEEIKRDHIEEIQEKDRHMDLERKEMDDRIGQLQKAFELFSSEDKLLTFSRKMVADNQKMAQQLNAALSQIEALSSERELDEEILQQCRREVELYMQSNNLNIQANLALKKANQNLKKIIHDKYDVAQSEEID